MSPPVHPLLATAFAALDRAAICWCLLRGEAALGDPTGDVDLLVAPGDVDRLDAVLAGSFLRLQRWGAGGHRLYLGYHRPTDRWIELDVESDVEFGPAASFVRNWVHPSLRVDVAAGVLRRRRRRCGVWVPDADDGFWLLLLHCIVDKGGVSPAHRSRLWELAGEASADDPVAAAVAARCGPVWDPAQMIDWVRRQEWASLVAAGSALPGQATAGSPTAARASALARGVCRLCANARRVGEGRGFSVALLGPDGAGKSTLAAGLASSLGLPTRVVYMGLWQGEGGSDPRPSLARAAARAASRPLKAWRKAASALYHQGRGRVVVYDRHPLDALLPPSPPHVLLKRVFFGFLARCVPRPSLTLVLDLPGEVAHRRRPEEDEHALDEAREGYLRVAASLPRAKVLRADRAAEELEADAAEQIWTALTSRRRPGGGGARRPPGAFTRARGR